MEVKCNHCGVRLKAPEGNTSNKIKCPRCQKVSIVLPQPVHTNTIQPQEVPQHFSPQAESIAAPRKSYRNKKTIAKSDILSQLPLILSCIALLFSLAGVYSFLKRPARMSDYNLTTPRKALMSTYKMVSDKAYLAILEHSMLSQYPNFDEMPKTLKIHKGVDYKDYKILFISYREDRKLVNKVVTMRQHEDTKLWYAGHGFVKNKKLREEMAEWEKMTE